MNYELLKSIPGADSTLILPSAVEKALDAKRTDLINECTEEEKKQVSDHERRLNLIKNEVDREVSQLPVPETKTVNMKNLITDIGMKLVVEIVFLLIMKAIVSSIGWLVSFINLLMVAVVVYLIGYFVYSLKKAGKNKNDYDDGVKKRESAIVSIQESGNRKMEMENLMHGQNELNELKKRHGAELDAFDRDVRECLNFYRSEYRRNRTESRDRFRSELEKQEFGVCLWFSGEIISFLESLKNRMEDSAFIKRARYEFTATASENEFSVSISGSDIEAENLGSRYKKKFDYFTANERIIPGSSTVEKWGYCAAIIDIVRAEVNTWLKNYGMSGSLQPDVSDEKLDSGVFSVVFDTEF